MSATTNTVTSSSVAAAHLLACNFTLLDVTVSDDGPTPQYFYVFPSTAAGALRAFDVAYIKVRTERNKVRHARRGDAPQEAQP